jgi:recombination directionality factor gp3-like protein
MTADTLPVTRQPGPIADGTALGIQRRFVEIGRIRLGEKGGRGEPKKLSKFRLTSASRAILEAAARIYGGTVRPWTGAPDEGLFELYTDADSIDIMVPPTMSAYSQFFEVWDAGGCTLRCDGRYESIAGKACDHGDHLQSNGEPMRVTTRVSVILPKLPGLGTWRLETHGWNAASTLPSSLELIGAVGRWVPALIRLEQRSSRTRDDKGKVLTRRFVVPVIDLVAATFGDMLAMGQASDEYPELGGGPGSLALPAGPSQPRGGTRVPRPEMAPEPPLEDEAAPLATSAAAAGGFPEATDDVFASEPAAAPTAAQDVRLDALVAQIRESAVESSLEGEPSPEQREALAHLFTGYVSGVTLGGIRAIFPDAVKGQTAKLTAAQASAILLVAGKVDADALRASWTQIAGQPL